MGWIQSPPPRCAEGGAGTAARMIQTDQLQIYPAASAGS